MSTVDDTVSQYSFGILGGVTREAHHRHNFWFAFSVAEFFGVLAVLLLLIWAWKFVGFGDAFLASFAYHPVFMVFGLVFLTGQSILVFRLFRGTGRNSLKVVHMTLNLVALICLCLGLFAIFTNHNPPHFANPHDWIGATVVSIVALQLVFGFVAKFFPGAPPAVREWYDGVHRFFGVLAFGLACVTACMGMAIAGQNDGSFVGHLGRLFVVAVVVYAIVVVYLLASAEFARPQPTDESAPLVLNAYAQDAKGGRSPVLDLSDMPDFRAVGEASVETPSSPIGSVEKKKRKSADGETKKKKKHGEEKSSKKKSKQKDDTLYDWIAPTADETQS